jgi:hypothetical protein
MTEVMLLGGGALSGAHLGVTDRLAIGPGDR